LKVSVIIPTLNRHYVLLDTLKDILNQKFEDYEVLVVDQSDEIPREIFDFVKKYKNRIKYFYKLPFKGLPQARNFGFQFAQGDILIYIDDDIRTDNMFIKNHFDIFNDSKIGVSGGKVIEEGMGNGNKVGKFNPWTFKITTNFANDSFQKVDHIKGCNFAVKKSVLNEINGFDEKLSIGAALYEELEMNLRVRKKGYKIVFNPKAALRHLVAPSGGCRVKDIPKYMFGLAHNRTLIINRHLKIYQKPFAYLRLMLLGLSYSKLDKSIKPLISTLKGIKQGIKSGKDIKFTDYSKVEYCTI